jgi:ribosome-associated protein
LSLKLAAENLDKENTILNDKIIESIQDTQGNNIVQLDLRNLSERPADFFIVCDGESRTKVKAIADKIESKLAKDLQLRPNHVEGKSNATWILVDYFDTIIHIFHPESREFYQLEELWSDAKRTEYITF